MEPKRGPQAQLQEVHGTAQHPCEAALFLCSALLNCSCRPVLTKEGKRNQEATSPPPKAFSLHIYH